MVFTKIGDSCENVDDMIGQCCYIAEQIFNRFNNISDSEGIFSLKEFCVMLEKQLIVNELKDVNVSILKNLTIQHGLTLTLIGDINASIIRNLSNDDGFFIPLFQEINSSILSNFSLSTLTSSVSTTDQIAIGEECAIQTLRQNLTIKYYYNRSSFSLANVTFNYTGVGIFINESYNYDNESYLSNVTRADHLG
ncbi:hypothetical protein LCGC14_2696700 [marine sediment metagenome]|uniref:Uncharacterized protein n=1 Tax=marine sediment metagenome TaxID=412755 RepID=A0A0F9C8Q3_9ZZZZ